MSKWRRPIHNNLDTLIQVLHNVLLLVENDEDSYRHDCSWSYVKRHVKLSVIQDLKNGAALIKSLSDPCELEMKKSGSIASDFLVRLRHCFAHNRISYDRNSNTVSLYLNGLEGQIGREALEEIIQLIIESKKSKTK